MSTAVYPAQARAAARTTPEILRSCAVAVWIACLLLMGAAISGARDHRHAIQAVGKDSAPSIIAAQKIRWRLADMDAHAIAADAKFEEERGQAAEQMVRAAKNITYNEEYEPIRRLTSGLSVYAAKAQQARDRRDVNLWREAWQYLDGELLRAADELDAANRKELDKTYEEQGKGSSTAVTMLILAALVAGVALIGTQIFVTGRMRRLINPLLLLATMAAFIFTIYAAQRFQAARHDLKVAKEDAFESIHALLKAEAFAYSAQTDLIRAAADPAERSGYESEFGNRAEAVRKLLADELKNITFAGEEEPARLADAKFREYEAARTPAAFAEFDEALRRTMEVNQKAFDAAVERGFADVAWFEVVAPCWAIAIALKAWFGLQPRIREYSA